MKCMCKYAVMLFVVSIGSFAQGETSLVSNFDTGLDGWGVVDLYDDSSNLFSNPPTVVATYQPSWNASGGNPGGFISMSEPSGNWWMFSASSSFIGDKSSYFDGTFDYSLKCNPQAYPGSAAAVVLVGSSDTLYFNTNEPQQNWTDYSVPLSPSGWKLNDWENGLEPSTSQMQSVLASLNAIYISGDWITGFETTGLDSVCLASIPEPSTLALLATGIVSVLFIDCRRRRQTS